MRPYAQDLAQQFKPEKLPVGWPWRLFSFAALIFLVILLIYLGLGFGYKPFLFSRIENLDAQIDQLGEMIPAEQESDLTNFYSQSVNLKKVLDNHPLTSRTLGLLERITHQQVYYSDWNLKVPERQLTLEGVAASYGVLGEQLAVFDSEPMIEKSILGQSRLEGGNVKYKVILTLAKDFLTK